MKTEENDYENHKKREEDPYTKSESIYYSIINYIIKLKKTRKQLKGG